MPVPERILFTTHWFPSEDHISAGIFVKKHLEAIRSSGIAVDAFVIRILPGKSIVKKEVVAQEGFTELVIRSRFWKFIYVLYFLQNWLLWPMVRPMVNGNYDLVHGNVGHPNGAVAAYWARRLGIPYVITEHHTEVDRLCRHWYFGRPLTKVYRNAAMIYPVSAMLRDAVAIHAPHVRQQVIGNVIDASVFRFDGTVPPPADHIRLLAIGTWDRSKYNYKQPDLLIKAIDQFAAEENQITELIHIGQCPIQDELVGLITSGNFRIQFLGQQAPEKINSELNRSHLFVHATANETFCVVGVEAQKTGIPIVISNVEPIPKVVDHEGVVFTENTVEDWVRNIRIGLKLNVDRKVLAEKVKDRYSAKQIGADYLQAYNNV